jgi:hypothetical protein
MKVPAFLTMPATWKIAGAAVALGLTALVFKIHGDMRYHEGELDTELKFTKNNAAVSVAHEREISKIEQTSLQRVISAQDAYANRLQAQEPMIIRAIDKVTTYAQTPAGRATCLAADRVSDILEARRALSPANVAASTSGAIGTLSEPLFTPPTGRVDVQRGQ